MITTGTALDGAWHPELRPQYGSPEFYLAKLEQVVGFDYTEPEGFDALLQRLSTVWIDNDRQSLLLRIEQLAPVVSVATLTQAEVRQLPEGMQERLTTALIKLVEDAESLPAADRVHADRAISRLSRLLTYEQAWQVVSPWFGDRRKFRRQAVVRALRKLGAPQSHAAEIINQYRESLDHELLKLISFNPHVAALLEEKDVITALAVPANDLQIGAFTHLDTDARYWWMRAIDAYLIGGHVPPDEVAFGNPNEFAWAVGRGSHRHGAPLLRRVLEERQNDPEFVWRAMRAFERVGEKSDMEAVRSFASRLVATARSKEHAEAVA